MLCSQFPAFDGEFMPWKYLEPFFAPDSEGSVNNEPNSSPDLSCYHVGSESDLSSPSSDLVSGSGSDDPNQNPAGFKFGSSCYNDERKRKRMMSNRESARRSRMRRQRHLDNLRNQANRLKMENRELVNRLRCVNHHNHRVRSDNDRFIIESVILQRRLLEISQIMQLQQLQRRQNYSSACMPKQ